MSSLGTSKTSAASGKFRLLIAKFRVLKIQNVEIKNRKHRLLNARDGKRKLSRSTYVISSIKREISISQNKLSSLQIQNFEL